MTGTRAESDAVVDRIQAMIAEHGFGFWAVERKAGRPGDRPGRPADHGRRPTCRRGPAIEVGWRFAS
jgi:hypothetical protein